VLHSYSSAIGVSTKMKEHQRKKVTIKIPRPLYEKIGKLIEGAGYNSVTDFVVYVLRDIVSAQGRAAAEVYSEEDIAKVKEHLRTLGYL